MYESISILWICKSILWIQESILWYIWWISKSVQDELEQVWLFTLQEGLPSGLVTGIAHSPWSFVGIAWSEPVGEKHSIRFWYIQDKWCCRWEVLLPSGVAEAGSEARTPGLCSVWHHRCVGGRDWFVRVCMSIAPVRAHIPCVSAHLCSADLWQWPSHPDAAWLPLSVEAPGSYLIFSLLFLACYPGENVLLARFFFLANSCLV